MEEPDRACCPRGQSLSEQQWKELIDAGRALKPILWRRWRRFRSSIEDAVAEAVTNFAAKVMKGAVDYPPTFNARLEALSQEATTFLKREKRHCLREAPPELRSDADTAPHSHNLSVGLSSRWMFRRQSQNSPRSFVRQLIWSISMTNPSPKRQKRSAARQIHSSNDYFERVTN